MRQRRPWYAVVLSGGLHQVMEFWPAIEGWPAEESIVFTGMDRAQAQAVADALTGWARQGDLAEADADAIDQLIQQTGGRP